MLFPLRFTFFIPHFLSPRQEQVSSSNVSGATLVNQQHPDLETSPTVQKDENMTVQRTGAVENQLDVREFGKDRHCIVNENFEKQEPHLPPLALLENLEIWDA